MISSYKRLLWVYRTEAGPGVDQNTLSQEVQPGFPEGMARYDDYPLPDQ